MRIVIAAIGVALAATTATAGVPDNLQCYELTNGNLRGLRATVDLDAPATGLAPGCKVSRAKMYCTPAEATVQPGSLNDGGHPLDEVPFQSAPADGDRVCYAVKCPYPVGTAPDQVVTDRFTTHHFKQLRTEMMCVPVLGATTPPPAGGFQIKFPETEIDPGGDVTYCYYFRTPNAATMPIGRFTSTMSPYAQQLIAFTTTNGSQGYPVERIPPGIVSAADCSPLPQNGIVPNWMYSANDPQAELTFPKNDGTGKPLALELPPLSSGFLLLHTVNPTNEIIKTSATVNFEPLASPVYTKTDTYMMFSQTIDIPPFATNFVESKTCTTPDDAQFWNLTTLTHKRAQEAQISERSTVIVDTLDWQHPSAEILSAPPYRTFATKKLTYGCRYTSTVNRTIHRGPSYQTDEECLAVGYFFPATRPLQCYGGIGPY